MTKQCEESAGWWLKSNRSKSNTLLVIFVNTNVIYDLVFFLVVVCYGEHNKKDYFTLDYFLVPIYHEEDGAKWRHLPGERQTLTELVILMEGYVNVS